MILLPPRSTLFPYTTLFRSIDYVLSVSSSVSLMVLLQISPLQTAVCALDDENQDLIQPTASTDRPDSRAIFDRSEEHTSELQSLRHLVCRLLLEKKKNKRHHTAKHTPTHKHITQQQETTRTARATERPRAYIRATSATVTSQKQLQPAKTHARTS